MRNIFILTVGLLFSFSSVACSNSNKMNVETIAKASPPKILVAYLSHTGSTQALANQIHEFVGGDIFKIETEVSYPIDYEKVKTQAQQELHSGYKPILKSKVKEMNSYDVIFIGSPIWWGRVSPPIMSFLSEYDLSGKKIIPFCTHLGSGQGQSIADITALTPNSTVLKGIAIWANAVPDAYNDVSTWLRKIGILKSED